MAARNAVKASWTKNKTDNFDSASVLESYVKVQADPAAKVKVIDTKGDAKAAFAGAAKVYSADYRSDYSYHAQMEPLNAVARFNEAGDKLEVWDGSQDLGRSRDLIAKALGLKPEQVDVHQCYLGGGFGRRSLADYAARSGADRARGQAAGEAALDARGGHRLRHVPSARLPARWRRRSMPTARSPAGGTAASATTAMPASSPAA